MKKLIRLFLALTAALVLVSCGSEGEDAGVSARLELKADRVYIQINTDEVVNLTAMCDGEDVTDQTTFYIGETPLEGPVFIPAETGVYEIWANYGTENSNIVKITAIAVSIPETPVDEYPDSVGFVPRVLLSQFTGTGCGNCPRMMTLLHGEDGDEGILHDSQVGGSIVWVAVHTFDTDDLAYCNTTYSSLLGATSYPSANVDYLFSGDFSSLVDYNTVDNLRNNLILPLLEEKSEAACGISVNSSLSDGQIVMKTTVKSAQDNSYRVGAFLLQDGIKDRQSGVDKNSWMNTHNSCVRWIDAGGKVNDFDGYGLGDIARGETAEHLFIWDLESVWAEMQGNIFWENKSEFLEGSTLRLVVFVVSVNAEGNYHINNVVEAPVNGILKYEYTF